MKAQFNGKVTWITGASAGIGRALAIEMAKRGAIVALSARRVEKLKEVSEQIKAMSQEFVVVPCDVTDEAQISHAAQTIVHSLGKLDIVVANAGYSVKGSFETVTIKDWRKQLDVNVIGVVATLKAALPYLRQTKGRAAVISSVAGKLATAHISAYCASKFALVGLCNSLYQELYGTGVSLTNILPGLIATEIAQVDNQGTFNAKRIDRRPKQLMWSAENAAIKIADAVYERKREAVITGHGKVATFLGQHFEGPITNVLARFAQKGADKFMPAEAGDA